MHFELHDRTIFLGVSGSRAYGTATPESDWDLRGIAVAPRIHYLGFAHRFDQFQGRLDWPEITAAGAQVTGDVTVFDLRKFMALATDANPNILELLFLPRPFWIVNAPQMDRLREHRHLFLSKKMRHTFAGYAHSQLKRIRTHRRWLLSPPKAKPERADRETLDLLCADIVMEMA